MHACETVIMGTLLLRRESLLVYRVSKHSGWMYCSLTSEKHSALRYAFWNWLIYIRKLDFKTRESRKRKANSKRGSLALLLTAQTILIFQSWTFLFLITFVQKKGCLVHTCSIQMSITLAIIDKGKPCQSHVCKKNPVAVSANLVLSLKFNSSPFLTCSYNPVYSTTIAAGKKRHVKIAEPIW